MLVDIALLGCAPYKKRRCAADCRYAACRYATCFSAASLILLLVFYDIYVITETRTLPIITNIATRFAPFFRRRLIIADAAFDTCC